MHVEGSSEQIKQKTCFEVQPSRQHHAQKLNMIRELDERKSMENSKRQKAAAAAAVNTHDGDEKPSARVVA
jgi:hypothetical protein